jgi:3-hydroxyacyl-CoA dehydrogenase
MNKEPIVVRDVPGFASSRLGVRPTFHGAARGASNRCISRSRTARRR